MNSNDDSASVLERVRQATVDRKPLDIVGGNSKAHLGNRSRDASGAVNTDDSGALSLLAHSGVISYEPTELVVTVRAGTLLGDLNQCLTEAGQMLPFEPPEYTGCTIGGVLACGLSGPRRPFAGSARDYVLGTRIINGQAQDLSFGGQVMKNVAGYDVSRVQVGAWGTLGVLLDISMKVLPLPERELTLQFDMPKGETASFSALMRQPLPLSGAMSIDGMRYLRLSGSESAVQAAARQLGGEQVHDGNKLWKAVRNQKHPFFMKTPEQINNGCCLWRVSVADHTPPLDLSGDWLHEWAGAQRWLMSAESPTAVFNAVAAAGGHAIRYEAGPLDQSAFQPLHGALRTLQSRVRDSFDPHRLFNRGRFHPELDRAPDPAFAVSA